MDRVQELLFVKNKITKEYESLLLLLEDPEVVKVVQFLSELDALAEHYSFSSEDIIQLIDPSRAGVGAMPDGFPIAGRSKRSDKSRV